MFTKNNKANLSLKGSTTLCQKVSIKKLEKMSNQQNSSTPERSQSSTAATQTTIHSLSCLLNQHPINNINKPPHRPSKTISIPTTRIIPLPQPQNSTPKLPPMLNIIQLPPIQENLDITFQLLVRGIEIFLARLEFFGDTIEGVGVGVVC